MLTLLFLVLAAQSSPDPLDVEGVWWTEGRTSQVTIEKEEAGPVGRITWYENIDEVRVSDTENPDEAKRGRPLLGLPIVEGFEKGRDAWRRGSIYDPTKGKTYRSSIFRIDEETLGVKGCVAMICLTQEWARVPSDEVATPAR